MCVIVHVQQKCGNSKHEKEVSITPETPLRIQRAHTLQRLLTTMCHFVNARTLARTHAFSLRHTQDHIQHRERKMNRG